MYLRLLKEERWDLFIGVFTECDRLHHYFWKQYVDPAAPHHARFLDFYRRLDEIIGELIAALPRDIPLFVVADHGHTLIHREFYPNAWLRADGLLRFTAEKPKGLADVASVASVGGVPITCTIAPIGHGTGQSLCIETAGKPVAVESGALGAFVLSRALALNGMQAGDVTVVHLESNEQPSAFEKGQVDGAVTFDPYRAQLLQAGAVTLFDSTQIPGEIVDLIAVRASVLDKQPKAIHFVRVEDLPRSTTGKIQRHEIEGWLARGTVPAE